MGFVLISSILCLLFVKYTNCAIVVCYYTNWAQYRNGQGRFTPTNIDSNLCDNIIFAFGDLKNSSLTTYEWNDDGMIAAILAQKQVNPSLKVSFALGGWNDQLSKKLSNIANNQNKRQKFVQSVVQFLKNKKLDGFDLDWEYPNKDNSRPSDKQSFTILLKELKVEFKPNNFILTAAVAAGISTIKASYEIQKIANYVDWINLMTYDFHGSWESFTGHNAPLYARTDELGDQKTLNIDSSVKYWINNGFPANKIVLGTALYGRSYTLANSKNFKPGASSLGAGTAGHYTDQAGILSYYEICHKIKNNWTIEFDSQQKVPYIHKGNQWISFDNIDSLKIKADYVKSQSLGGVMFWTLDSDDFSGLFCNQGNYPLINAVRQQLIKKSGDITSTSTAINKSTATKYIPKVSKMMATSGKRSCYKGDGYYADRSNGCKSFYRCHSSFIYNSDCPSGLLFDERSNVCNWSSMVQC